MISNPDDFQESVLRGYTLLRLLDPSSGFGTGWGGGLVISVGLDTPGASVALAANIAGAVSLAIDAVPERCRAALRTGACDFAVNSVDEALRVIKNEIRKHQPLSVALAMQPDEALAELIGRGVKPQLFVPSDNPAAVSYFQSLATPIVHFDRAPTAPDAILDGRALLEHHSQAQNLNVDSFTFASAPSLRAFDARAAELLAADPTRLRWSLAAPRHFLRERPHRRVLLLHPDERAVLQRESPDT